MHLPASSRRDSTTRRPPARRCTEPEYPREEQLHLLETTPKCEVSPLKSCQNGAAGVDARLMQIECGERGVRGSRQVSSPGEQESAHMGKDKWMAEVSLGGKARSAGA